MEKNLLRKSGIVAVIIAFSALAFWFGFAKLSLGAYNEKNLTYQFLKEDSEVFKTLVIEVGSDTVARIIAGTSSMTRTGTSSYPGQPRIEYSGVTGKWSFKNSGGTETTAIGTVTASYVAAEIGSTAANYVLQNNGSSTGQLATDAILAGQGTITATFNIDGLDISPPELSMVDGATIPLNTVAGSLTSHAHTGSDGTTQIAHDKVTGTGTNSHAVIDTFIASKASASGVASLDANSLVVQNPASGTSTPSASKTVMSDGTSKISNGWLNDSVTKLGTPTTDNIAEGSANKYYTDARVNSAVGSLTINTLSDVNVNMANENDFLKIVGGQVVAGSSSVTVAFSEVTGSATASQLPSTIPYLDVSGNLFASGIVGGTTTGALKIPVGTTAQRPGTPTSGMLRITSNDTGEGNLPSYLASGGIITSPITGTRTAALEIYIANWTNLGGTFTSNLGSYTVHTFTSSGTFTVTSGTITAEVLVVAGGGGGGNAGGGAGGMEYYTNALTGAYTVTVGAGGASLTNGNNTSIGTMTAIGGGYGGDINGSGSPGGSGGGAGGANGATSAGTGTANQGNDGGTKTAGTPYTSGGGGGNGAVGGNGSGSQSGAGGVGKEKNISGSNVTYAGGGGGGATNEGAAAGVGGSGGGGNGGSTGGTAGSNGIDNTGGGGGGGGRQNPIGGIGGSGIVIIRYPAP